MEAAVRLSKSKREHLSDRILKLIQDDPQIHILTNIDLVVRAVDDAIFENLLEEQQIDDEVEALLDQNYHEIRASEMDVGALRSKMKREICRKKGFVL